MPIQKDGWSTHGKLDWTKKVGPFDLEVTTYASQPERVSWGVYTDSIPNFKCILGEAPSVEAAKRIAERFCKTLEPLLEVGS